jgi:hypothetical protein
MYHNFKRSQGVSEEEIESKAASVKDVMFINEPAWYQETLKELGFNNIVVLHQVPCFTTFLAFKS